MQLVLERDAFLKEMARVSGAIEAKSKIPILQYVRLDAGAEMLLLRGTDLDMEVTAACPADVTAQGVICVDAKVLHDLVKKLPSGAQIGLTLEKDGTRLKIVAGSSRFLLPTLGADEFPSLEYGDGGRSFILDAGELRELFDAVRFAVSTDDTRYYLNGVYLHQDGERLAAVATDGHRLSARFAPLPAQADGMAGVILGRKLVGELIKTLPSEGEIALEVSEKRIAVSWADIRIVSKLIDGTFPDWKRVMVDPPHRIVADRKQLMAMVERVAVVLREKGSQAVALCGGAEGLTVTANSGLGGQGSDRMDAMVEGPEITIGANYSYLLDILGHCDGDTAVIRYSEHTDPMLISADGTEDQHSMILMPIRIDKVTGMKEAA